MGDKHFRPAIEGMQAGQRGFEPEPPAARAGVGPAAQHFIAGANGNRLDVGAEFKVVIVGAVFLRIVGVLILPGKFGAIVNRHLVVDGRGAGKVTAIRRAGVGIAGAIAQVQQIGVTDEAAILPP